MTYPAISARRMAYDIDGTEIGYRHGGSYATVTDTANNGIASWLTNQEKQNLNNQNKAQVWALSYAECIVFWLFFPESREITGFSVYANGATIPPEFKIQGSSDSTNGMDDTWENATFTAPTPDTGTDGWRKTEFAVSFSGPVKVLRIGRTGTPGGDASICAYHIYGQKAAGQTPDDIIFCNSSGAEVTALTDWGDVPEGTTQYKTFYLKNVSSKLANGVNIQLNHADFLISTDQATWTSVIDITSLGAGQISAPIYTKLQLGPPLLTLGPKAARTIVTTASWS